MDFYDIMLKIFIAIAFIAILCGLSVLIGIALHFWFKVPLPLLS